MFLGSPTSTRGEIVIIKTDVAEAMEDIRRELSNWVANLGEFPDVSAEISFDGGNMVTVHFENPIRDRDEWFTIQVLHCGPRIVNVWFWNKPHCLSRDAKGSVKFSKAIQQDLTKRFKAFRRDP